ncbi:MAG: hypothetical protein P4L84_04500, partial [Isosphaeraceae bacterium]|nr:hypothetical protein [Isosphaeraceae bacterium]
MGRRFGQLMDRAKRAREPGLRTQFEILEPRWLLSLASPAPAAPDVSAPAGEFSILRVSPDNGTVVSALPGGQVIVTLSQPVAGLS